MIDITLQDIFKVSGKQVSPTEIENTIREHPSQFVTDVAVAGVKGERLPDELVPRAWIVLSNIGKECGVETVLADLEKWVRSRLSKHKWLRGGFQVVDEVSRDHWARRKMNDSTMACMLDTETPDWKDIAPETAGRVC